MGGGEPYHYQNGKDNNDNGDNNDDADIHDMMGSVDFEPLSRNIDHRYLSLRWGVLKICWVLVIGYWILDFCHNHDHYRYLCLRWGVLKVSWVS